MNRWFFALLLTAYCFLPTVSYAQSASNIQAQIDIQSQKINALRTEIERDQQQLDVLGTKKSTLQSTISTLTLSQKQLVAQIQITQAKIASANLQIQQLSFSIGDKESSIATDQIAIRKALRIIAEGDQRSLITQLVSADTLGDAWQITDHARQFNRALGSDIDHLQATRTVLATNRDQVSAKKTELVKLQSDLTLQKRSIDASKIAQTKLLAETKNQEANYQKLITEKEAAGKAFEQELFALESQLNLIVNPGSLPKVGTGLLSWPFINSFMQTCASRKNTFKNIYCITQYFGNTPFSTANPQIYNGKGHIGVDFGAPHGTPVTAALSGTVLAIGNTDATPGCVSFGRWVMIRHNNGISTLYSHLSRTDVSEKQNVATGQILGLSGGTIGSYGAGASTGAHLHFGVYATEGTQIRGLTGRCTNALMPVAVLEAYLNPLSYL